MINKFSNMILNKGKALLGYQSVDMTVFQPGGEGWLTELGRTSSKIEFECRSDMMSVTVSIDIPVGYEDISREAIFDRLMIIRKKSKSINLFDYYGYPYSNFVDTWIYEAYEYLKKERFFLMDTSKIISSDDGGIKYLLYVACIVDVYSREISEELISECSIK